jgi:hypothetical protein
MPQHLWHTYGDRRLCDACEVRQIKKQGRWEPEVPSICPGDGHEGSNRRRPRPSADAPKAQLEECA